MIEITLDASLQEVVGNGVLHNTPKWNIGYLCFQNCFGRFVYLRALTPVKFDLTEAKKSIKTEGR